MSTDAEEERPPRSPAARRRGDGLRRRSSLLRSQSPQRARQSADGTLSLRDTWTFYYNEKPPAGMAEINYENMIKTVGSFDTIQGFWRYYNNFVDPSSFPKGSNLHMFRGKIRPVWEDPHNVQGGRWITACPKNETGKLWISIVLALLGSRFPFPDELCGAVLSVKNDTDTLSVWIRNTPDNPHTGAHYTANFETLNSLLLSYQVYFQPHAQSSVKKEEAPPSPKLGPMSPKTSIRSSGQLKTRRVGSGAPPRKRSFLHQPQTQAMRTESAEPAEPRRRATKSSSFCVSSDHVTPPSRVPEGLQVRRTPSSEAHQRLQPSARSHSVARQALTYSNDTVRTVLPSSSTHRPTPVEFRKKSPRGASRASGENVVLSPAASQASTASFESSSVATSSRSAHRVPPALLVLLLFVLVILFYCIFSALSVK